MFEDYMKHFVLRSHCKPILFYGNCEEFKNFFTSYGKYYISQNYIFNVIKLIDISDYC